MGAHPYWYFVKYEPDINQALQQLREREFKAGRYNPVIRFLEFPLGPDAPSLGAAHPSIKKAIKAADADGTRSILDIERVSDEPDFSVAAPLSDDILQALYGTKQPTRQMLEEKMDFLEELERGHCVYAVVYKDGRPDEIFFAGYSFD